ncbi:MAG TPA: hypothetical protein VFN78_08245, partial [Ktedonobacterales bacterium]|nr:hypothetical protein [Ktedonobacterales bacterium]
LALRAGADIALISHHIEAQRGAIAQVRAAVASGALPDGAITQATERVLLLKAQLGAWDALPATVATGSVSDEAHQRLSEAAYARSTTLVRDDAHLLPLRLPAEARLLIIAQPPASVTRATDTAYQHDDLVRAVRAYHAAARGVCLAPDASADDVAALLDAAQEADLLIVVTINAHLNQRQADLMRRLVVTGRSTVGIIAGDPYDLAAIPTLRTALATYEYTRPALSAAVRALFGVLTPRGRLPVSL